MKTAFKYLGSLFLLASFAGVVILQFTNPDMTQVRLLISFYKEYAVIIALALVGYFLVAGSEEL